MLTDLSPQHIETMLAIRRDPCYWTEKILGISVRYKDPWGDWRWYESQKKLLETPFRMRPEAQGATAAGSGHQTSKTESVKNLAIIWMLSHYPAFVIILGDTWPAVTNKIMPGIKARVLSANKHIQKMFEGKLPAEMLKALHYFDPKNLPDKTQWEWGPEYGIYGFSPQNAEPIQGYHSKGKWGGTLVIADEANAVAPEFIEPLKVYSKNPRNYVMFLGNPTSQDSPFSSILRHEAGFEGWDTFAMSSWDTPNAKSTLELIERGELTIEEALSGKEFIAEDFEGLATFSYCYEQQQKHPNIYHPRVLGLPPDQSDDTWISRATITACGERWAKSREKYRGESQREQLLIDPSWSRDGDPSVVLCVDPDRDCVTYADDPRGLDEAGLIGKALGLCLARPAIFEIVIEGDGIGAPFGNRLRALLEDEKGEEDPELRALRARLMERGRIPHVEIVQSGGPAHDAVANGNRKAENWRRMKAGLETLAIPPEMLDQFYEISKVKYLENSKGQLLMEPKKDFKKRGNPSPGHADALALNYARPVGDPLFSVIERTKKNLQMDMQPAVIVGGQGNATCYWKRLGPTVAAREGRLARAWWYSRAGDSAAVWVHADKSQNWTVLAAVQMTRTHLQELTRRVFEESFDENGAAHQYAVDVCCAHDASAKVGAEDYYHDVIDAELRKLAREKKISAISTPYAMPPAEVSGLSGLDVLDRKIANHGVSSEDVLAIWPSMVVRDLMTARFRNPSANLDQDEDRPEEGVGGGGALVRCLRLLAVHGVR